MSNDPEFILSTAMKLDDQQRLALSNKLYESVHGSFDESVEAEWIDEIAQRIADTDAGSAGMVPGDQTMKKVRDALDGRSE